MSGRFQRLLIPFFYCLAVACLVEIPLAQTDMFGEDVILWDTLFRTILAMPGLWYFYREDQQLRAEVKWDFTVMVKLAAVGAIASIVFRILFEFIGMPGYESVEQNLLSGNLMLQIIVLLASSPMLEEFFFRGVLYGRLKEVVSVNHAIWISALGFGLYHANLSQGIYGFLMGLFLAWSMEKFQTVKAPIAVHIGSNLAAMCMEWI
ncbi:MAG: CPBP family intramembrane metalloprotease [Lachnospiraceae bacterium]|nr:CPBP family intramembrane metalloprotease [Lachnospiraceae bacterium]